MFNNSDLLFIFIADWAFSIKIADLYEVGVIPLSFKFTILPAMLYLLTND
jgi:hypothetical protein